MYRLQHNFSIGALSTKTKARALYNHGGVSISQIITTFNSLDDNFLDNIIATLSYYSNAFRIPHHFPASMYNILFNINSFHDTAIDIVRAEGLSISSTDVIGTTIEIVDNTFLPALFDVGFPLWDNDLIIQNCREQFNIDISATLETMRQLWPYFVDRKSVV